MPLKKLHEIWDEYLEHATLSAESKRDLIWHLQNDEKPIPAIILTTDMKLKEMVTYIAPYLTHEKSMVREITVSHLVGRLCQVQYAEKAFQMVTEDSDSGVRTLALSSLGYVLDDMEKDLQTRIVKFILDLIEHPKEVEEFVYDPETEECEYPKREQEGMRRTAYNSMIKALGVWYTDRPSARQQLQKPLEQDEYIQAFKKKYGVQG